MIHTIHTYSPADGGGGEEDEVSDEDEDAAKEARFTQTKKGGSKHERERGEELQGCTFVCGGGGRGGRNEVKGDIGTNQR
jgi:hypothetical protein